MEREAVIWTESGTWLQTRKGDIVRSSYVGRLSLGAVEGFCSRRGIKLVLRESRGRSAGNGSAVVPCPGH